MIIGLFGKKAVVPLISVTMLTVAFSVGSLKVSARESYLSTLNVGVAQVLDGCGDNDPDEVYGHLRELADEVLKEQEGVYDPEERIVMADVNEAANVRVEPDADSELAGLLYKDCGGRILEQKDGWTRIESGELVGWIRDDLLFFDEEAEELAEQVGFRTVSVLSDALRVRKEASDLADVEGIITKGDRMDIDDSVHDVPPGWVAIQYDGDTTGYVRSEYVNASFRVDSGETKAAIEERERKEEEERKKKELRKNRGAVIANADETRLLAALIQCEAGAYNYEGCLAVGAVVMNRVRSPAYPNTISGVIYASGQFTPARNGRMNARYASNISPVCVQAATDALNGGTNVGAATHFRRWNGVTPGILIANQVFY